MKARFKFALLLFDLSSEGRRERRLALDYQLLKYELPYLGLVSQWRLSGLSSERKRRKGTRSLDVADFRFPSARDFEEGVKVSDTGGRG